MKILSMSATFGKLEGQTLTLEPGLNVIHAPNEWGKSTWCGFIVAMLYGIETSQRSSSKGLADKERFAPWSGKPMSGRMDIEWNGRKITLERSSKGRSVFGVFRAYETETGMDVKELTAENCGLTLLGVEKNVFTRAGFVRQADMPLTDDLALRRRLNELVTTGDESGDSDKLAQKLKDLKNACRHNKTGLLPQAESQRNLIQDKLLQIETAQTQIKTIHARQEELAGYLQALENHKLTLQYEAAKANLTRVETAKAAAEAAQMHVRKLEGQCADLPAQEFAQKKLTQAETLQGRWANLQTKVLPQAPQVPSVFANLSPDAALQTAKNDKAQYDSLQAPLSPVFLILAMVGLLAGIGMFFVHPALMVVGLVFAGVFGYLHFAKKSNRDKMLTQLKERYGNLSADSWVTIATAYGAQEQTYGVAVEELEKERKALQDETEALTGGKSLLEIMDTYRQAITAWSALSAAKDDAKRASTHAEALASMVKEVAAPQLDDHLTLTEQETAMEIAKCMQEQSILQKQAGQFMGQIQTLGSSEDLARQLEQVNQRIEKLQDMYAALTIAQETLTDAANELQRRFAPQIAQKAQALFARMTGGRYDRLLLGQDLSVSTGAEGEDTLHGAQWRSDGTMDQLYLSVRMAVAEALTPTAPLVLDDAFVRFDDSRMAAAMELLKQESDHKQILVFTCQERECKYA